MTRRHKTVAFTPEQLAAKVQAILAFAEPAPPPPPVELHRVIPARRPQRPSPWSAEELADRALVITMRWSSLSGTDVRLSDGRRVAHLRLPMPAILSILQAVWDRPRGLGCCWEDLRLAEGRLERVETAHQ